MLWGKWAPLLRKSSRRLRAWALPSVCGGLDVALPVSIHTQSVTRYSLCVPEARATGLILHSHSPGISQVSDACMPFHFIPHKSLVFQLRSLDFCNLQSFDNKCMWGALLTGFG